MLDIFKPIVPEDKQHINFKNFMLEQYKYARDVVAGWTEGFVDRDNKIVQEFQTTFNSSFWEFYLNAALKNLGFNIDYSHGRPDFLIEKEGVRLALEATIASHPDGGKPEWDKLQISDYDQSSWFQIIHLSTIRIANAIYIKHKKFVEEYSELGHVKGLPFIICVAPFEQPFFYAQADNAIRRVLYKYSAPLYITSDQTGEIIVVGEELVDSVVKHNKVDIELGFFTNDGMKEVSAIIFSNTATATKAKALMSSKHERTVFNAICYQRGAWDEPYHIVESGGDYIETILDGLHVFLNPYASVPFDPNLFYSDEISLHDYDIDSNMLLEFVNDGFLLSRMCFSGHEKGAIDPKNMQLVEVRYKDYSFKWEECKLYALNATVGHGINNHIAHYKGWTVVVFQGSIDNDWSAFAKYKEVFTIQDFMLLDPNRGVAMKSLSDFYQTKEEAFFAIQKAIDEGITKSG